MEIFCIEVTLFNAPDGKVTHVETSPPVPDGTFIHTENPFHSPMEQ